MPRAGAAFDPVFDGILDQRLQEEIGNQDISHIGSDLEVNSQTVAKPGLLNFEVAPQEIEVLPERDLVFVGPVKAGAQQGRPSVDRRSAAHLLAGG